jgi:hypothetical protein
MSTIDRPWRILVAAAFLTMAWTAAAPAADLSNQTKAQPASPAVKTTATKPAKLRHARVARKASRRHHAATRLAFRVVNETAHACPIWPFCRGYFPLILGIAF